MALIKQENEMTEEQLILAAGIFEKLQRYRKILKENGELTNIIWIENEESGEFVAYTLGEERTQMKMALDSI